MYLARIIWALFAVMFVVPSGAWAAPANTYTLSGGTSPSAPLGHDDVLRVYLNGGLIETLPYNSSTQTVTFAAAPGSTLRVTVDDELGNCRALNPLYLHLSGGGGYVALDPSPAGASCGNTASLVNWYDRTFTIPATIPTLSEWGMILMAAILSITMFVNMKKRKAAAHG